MTATPVISVPTAPVISGGIDTSVHVTSTQAPPTNEGLTPSVLAGVVSGGAILLMIVSTLVVILKVKRKRTREKARHSVSSCTGLSNNMCIVY